MPVTLKELIHDDIILNRTPDLPSLRYESQFFRVFIWGNTKDLELSGRKITDGAITSDKFVPWYSIGDNTTYDAYCFDEVVDLEFADNLPKHAEGTPRQIIGELWMVPLSILLKLDKYYQNGYDFSRGTIKLMGWENDTVYTWMNWFDDIFEVNLNSQEYELRKGIDLVPFTTCANDLYYRYR